MSTPVYVTREAVKAALDVKETARSNAQIDGIIASSSRGVESFLHRVFYPTITTRYKDWPNDQYARAWRLWLDRDELVSLTSLTSGGTVIPAANYNLEPSNLGPPFTYIEIKLNSGSALASGSSFQRSVGLTGTFAGCALVDTAAGTLAAALTDTTATRVDVTDSASVGVGTLIKIDSERMNVTGKTMLTTGQTLQVPLLASTAGTLVTVTTGSAYTVGEILLLDSERMLITDIAGNNLIVERAYDGSTLATHTGSTIYAPRTLTVERGACGTTAATHLISAAVTAHTPPSLVSELTLAETLNTLAQRQAGYARTIGAGDNVRMAGGGGLADIRDRCYTAHGRKARLRAV